MLTVCCVKQGTLYSADYVNKLAASVRRNLTLAHQFVCFTDDPHGLNADIQIARLPDGLEGWWGKLALFDQANLGSSRILFFDLDTVILGSLDQIAAYDGPFAILRDFMFPKRWQSAVMAWAPSALTQSIWTKWNEAGRPRVNGGDQAWIVQLLNGQYADVWQDLFPGAFVSYKVDCFYMPPKPDAKVLCFHGEPRPHQCRRPFVVKAWRC